MNVMQRIGLAVFSLAAAAAISGEPPTRPAQSTGQRIIAPHQMFHMTEVEYCLRNVPELTEELSLAYTTYSVALSHAAEILSKRFPSQRVVDSANFGTDERARAFILKQIQSKGFSQCGPQLVQYLRSATGESLAKDYGDNFENLARQLAKERSQ